MRRTAAVPTFALLVVVLLAACGGGGTPSPGGTGAPPNASAVAPSAAASGPTIAAVGTFHAVDGEASGTVALELLADGSYAIVFEDFSIASADHIIVLVVTNTDVTATADVDPTKALDLGPLKGTSGMQDYPVPADMSAGVMTYHTVVLWDTAMTHALAAAALAVP